MFYAVEWVVFAGFAIFLWYRLVRDAVERERDEAEDGGAEAAAATTAPGTSSAGGVPAGPTDRSARGELRPSRVVVGAMISV